MCFSEYRTCVKRPPLTATAFLLAACLAAYIVALNLPLRLRIAALNLPSRFTSAKVFTDIAYGSDPTQKLDVYVPKHDQHKKLDVVVFFYGGRWEEGSKDVYLFAGTAFSDRGFITVVPDYRKYPSVKFPAFVEDGAKAVAWVYDHIGEYGGDPHRIHLAGHSAGAHIGSLIAANPLYLAALGKKSSDVVQDFAGLAGPYSFTPDEPDLMDIFGPPSNYPNMQVTTFIDGKQPAMLLLWGDEDTTVKRTNLDKLEAKIREKGGCVHSKIYPGIDHAQIVVGLSWARKRGANVADDIARFFREPKSQTCDRG